MAASGGENRLANAPRIVLRAVKLAASRSLETFARGTATPTRVASLSGEHGGPAQ